MVKLESLWQVYLQSKTLNIKSLRTETYRYNKHLRNYWKDFDMEKLKYKHVHAFMHSIHEKNLSDKSVAHCLNLLKAIINRAIEFEEYKNFLPRFPKITLDNRRERFLSQAEAEKLLFLLKNRSQLWHDITFIALNTGMRASEIFKMKKENIDFTNGIVRLYDTKNKHTRNVELGNKSFKIIKEYTELNLAFIFFEVPPRDVSEHFKSAVKEAGYNDGVTDRRNKVVFHTLRHTFASWLVQSGVSIFEVSKALGHRDISMTMRYAHLAPNHTKPAINKLEKDLLCIEKKRKGKNNQESLENKEHKENKKGNKDTFQQKRRKKGQVRIISLNSDI